MKLTRADSLKWLAGLGAAFVPTGIKAEVVRQGRPKVLPNAIVDYITRRMDRLQHDLNSMIPVAWKPDPKLAGFLNYTPEPMVARGADGREIKGHWSDAPDPDPHPATTAYLKSPQGKRLRRNEQARKRYALRKPKPKQRLDTHMGSDEL